jgi:cell division septum initiation protein DivIVA
MAQSVPPLFPRRGVPALRCETNALIDAGLCEENLAALGLSEGRCVSLRRCARGWVRIAGIEARDFFAEAWAFVLGGVLTEAEAAEAAEAAAAAGARQVRVLRGVLGVGTYFSPADGLAAVDASLAQHSDGEIAQLAREAEAWARACYGAFRDYAAIRAQLRSFDAEANTTARLRELREAEALRSGENLSLCFPDPVLSAASRRAVEQLLREEHAAAVAAESATRRWGDACAEFAAGKSLGEEE